MDKMCYNSLSLLGWVVCDTNAIDVPSKLLYHHFPMFVFEHNVRLSYNEEEEP